jgi:dihydroorotate dehydrogenase
MPNGLYPILRPLLFTLEPERAHALALASLQCAHALRITRASAQASAPVSLLGLSFPNRLGLAAGFDKNARYIDALGWLGFGFIEVGTVTPRAQAGQRKPRLFRIEQARVLINRMGFPNEGAAAIDARLSRRSYRGVCGVNIGKNATTSIGDATSDYVECFRAVAGHADYVAVNVSSPNTKDLRRLQQVDQLRPMLEALLSERERMRASDSRSVPLLVKISPDLSTEEMIAIAELIRELRMDGVIATNTTLSRPGVAATKLAAEEGGLSGAPLLPLALQALRTLRATLGSSIPIIAVGGIDSAAAARDAISAGADLVQIYTGLVYRGPALLREISLALHGSD